jgi:hypothetical protein
MGHAMGAARSILLSSPRHLPRLLVRALLVLQSSWRQQRHQAPAHSESSAAARSYHSKALTKSELAAVGVPPMDLLWDGLCAADVSLFAVEETIQLGRHPMDPQVEKWMGVIRHTLGSVGMILGTMGYVSDAQWQIVIGAVMALVPMVWSWKAKG